MHISEARLYQAEKDHLMRYEGKHPANYTMEEKMGMRETRPYDSMEFPA